MSRFACWVVRLVLGVCALAPFANAQTPGTGQTSWRKSCTLSDQGGQGCDVTVVMVTNGACSEGCPEFCVTISVACPEGIPAGDPGESCEETTCEICCNDPTAVSITCDGQTFTAKPKQGQGWEKVAKDCSELGVTTA